MRKYVEAVESARFMDGDVNYNDNIVLAEMRERAQRDSTKSLGNNFLDKYNRLYKDIEEQNSEYNGKQISDLNDGCFAMTMLCRCI